MNTKVTLASTALLLALSAPAALAAASDASEAWHGQGETFAADGQSNGTFALDIVDTVVSAGVRDSAVTITPQSGDVLHYTMRVSDADQGFSIKSDYIGNGGGYCFGEGLCQGEVTLPNGHKLALTIVDDRPGARRFLGTELVNGQAVKFIRESYIRVSPLQP